MNFRTTVILLVLLAGALAFFIVANRPDDTEQASSAGPGGTAANRDDNADRGRRLLDVKADQVKKLVVRPGEGAPAGAKPLELANADAKWSLVQPIGAAADSFETPTFVEAFTNARSTGSVDLTAERLASTGLAKPRYRVELTDAGGKVYKLAVGDRSALGHLYVRVGDEPTAAVVAGGPLGERLGRPTDKLVASLRDKQVLRTSAFDVKQVDVARPAGPPLALRKQGTDWKLTAPADVPAEASEVSDLISTLTNLRADEFSDEAAAGSAGASFDRPRAVVTLNTAAPATQPATGPATAPAGGVTVTIGQATDIDGEKSWVKVSDPPTVAKVSLNKAAIEKITKATPLSLRDRRVFAADPAQVSDVTIVTGSAGGATTVPSGTQPSAQKTVRLTRRQEKLEMGPFLPKGSTTAPSAGPATQPATAPTTGGPATKPSASRVLSPMVAMLALLQAEPASSPATQPATPATRPSAPATQSAIASPATVPTTSPAATQAVAATLPALPLEPPKPATTWVLASANDADADDAAVQDLLSDLNPLKAAKYLEKEPPATQPAAVTYVLTVRTVAPGGAATTHELRISDPGGEAKPVGRYKDLVFELDREVVNRLKKEFTPGSGSSATPKIPPSFPSGLGIPPP